MRVDLQIGNTKSRDLWSEAADEVSARRCIRASSI